MKAKGLVKGAVIDENGEEGEYVECVELDRVRKWKTLARLITDL